MPSKKYRVETEGGTYEVEVDEPRPLEMGHQVNVPGIGPLGLDELAKSGVEGATGFVKGLIPGAYHAIKDTIPGLIREGIATYNGGVNLLTDPRKTVPNAIDAIKGIPGKVVDAASSAVDLARQDPEAFGRRTGELTGAVEAGIAGSKLLPMAPKPAAKQLGNIMAEVGKKGAWPIRMMGAHQLGSGNPMGVATLMLPEALQKGGTALRGFAGETEGLPSGARNIDVGKVRSLESLRPADIDPAPNAGGYRIAYPVGDPVPVTPEGLPSGARNIDVDLASLQSIPAELPAAPATPKVPIGAHGEPPPLGASANDAITAGGQDISTMSPEVQARIRTALAAKAAPPPVAAPPRAPVAPVAPEAAVAPVEPLPDALPVEEAPVVDRPAKLPVAGNVPPTKSRNPMSATEGLTVRDSQSIGVPPNARILRLTPDLIEKLLQDRANMHSVYRSKAATESLGMDRLSLRDALEQALMDRKQ